MKMVNKIQDLTNQYPETRPVDKNYVGNSFIGKYPQNTITLSNVDVSNISPVDGNFRVIFSIDNQLFASSTYLSELKSSNNPYLSQELLPIIEFSRADLINTSDTAKDFKVREDYAEVVINNTLDSVNDLKQHISWLLDTSKTELRKPGVDYGSYNLITTKYNVDTKEGLRFDLSKVVETIEI